MIGAFITKHQVRKGFSAINRHDLDTLMGLFAESAVFEFPTGTVLGGRHQGEVAIRAWFARWFERMPKIQFTLTHVSLESPLTMGASNVAHAEWELNETDLEGNSYRLTGVTAFRVEGGKATYVKDYIFDQDVLEMIWGEKAASAAV